MDTLKICTTVVKQSYRVEYSVSKIPTDSRPIGLLRYQFITFNHSSVFPSTSFNSA